MSSYRKQKVVRVKVDSEFLAKHLGVKDVYELDCDTRYSYLFGCNQPEFQIAPTEEFFVDYVLQTEEDAYCGEYGKIRHLYETELKKYKDIFSKILPENYITDENIRVVEYCWYNCSECESYFEEIHDSFYDEI